MTERGFPSGERVDAGLRGLAAIVRRRALLMRGVAVAMRAMPIDVRRLNMWWRCAYASIGGGGFEPSADVDKAWPSGLQEPIRLRNGSRAALNLQDWSQRRTYFSGAYYQAEIELLLEMILEKGDIWIDVGANIGMVTLIAASRLGRMGSGTAVEPNPAVFQRLEHHVRLNKLDCVKCENVALGSADALATLAFDETHASAGSLVAQKHRGQIEVTVPVRRGDDLVKTAPGKALIIKIDVEGYELKVLAGLSKTLLHEETAVIVEVVDAFLQRAGGSAKALLAFFETNGYDAYTFELRMGRWKRHLAVRRVDVLEEGCKCDVLFVNRRATQIRSRFFRKHSPIEARRSMFSVF